MPKPITIPLYKTAPFIRLLLPFAIGTILQWYLQIKYSYIIISIVCFSISNFLFYLLPLSIKFKLQYLQGVIINFLLIAFGLFLTWHKDIRHAKNWYGNYYKDSSYIIAIIAEPPIEKTKSYKADVVVEAIVQNDTTINCKGKLLLYFEKDSTAQQLQYGDKILINKNLQQIKNSGNPGAFNYKQYAAFQQIFHQVFLKEKDWTTLPNKKVNYFQQFLFSSRKKILTVLQKNINSSKDELGIAEALLIGYTNDLDKDLVQAYTNTGVVHIIAISGMHLGLIYVILVWLFAKIPGIKKSRLLQLLLILICLWVFSLLTGAAASIIRSAVMFTFITVGKYFFKKASIYNSLAASAFVMLCYNPYYLWDVGFQLSYLAIISIVSFQKPISKLFYFTNKYKNNFWQLVAVTIAAQILTFPICLYYFHQFPNLFLITNVILVPLSDIVLIAQIILIALHWIPFVGTYLGKICNALVWLMNKIILFINSFSFAVWDKIPATILSTILLYATITALSTWLISKNKKIRKLFLISFLLFVLVHTYSKWQTINQHKIIVYNVPQHQAIDFIYGNKYKFIGDSILLQDALLQNFHLKPSRIALQLNYKKDSITNCLQRYPFYQYGGKKIFLADKPITFEALPQKINVDIIILSKNAKLYIPQLAQIFNCKQYVFDASNSLWKIAKWKKDCNILNLQYHSVPNQGAFIIDL